MARFFQGFVAAYLLAAFYHCAMFAQPGVVTPPGAAPIAALAWPVVLAPAFWRTIQTTCLEAKP